MRRARAARRSRWAAVRLYLHARSKGHKRLMRRAAVNLAAWQDFSHIVTRATAAGGGQHTDWCAATAEARYQDAIGYLVECDCPKSAWPATARLWVAPPRH